MGARSIREIVQCPDLMQWSRIFISTGGPTRRRFDFDVKLGNFEVIDLYGISYNIHRDDFIAGGQDISVDFGLSILEKSRISADTLAAITHDEFVRREEMLWVGNWGLFAQTTATIAIVGSENDTIFFPIPFCLIRPPTLEYQLLGSNLTANLSFTIYYMKRSATKTVYLQLLKYWQDAKQTFKSITQSDYDT